MISQSHGNRQWSDAGTELQRATQPLILIFWYNLPSLYLSQKVSNMAETFHSNYLELLPTEGVVHIVLLNGLIILSLTRLDAVRGS